MKKGSNKVVFVSVIVIAIIILIICKVAVMSFEKGMFKDLNEGMLKNLDKGGDDASFGSDWGFSKCPFSCYYNLFSSTMITNRPMLDLFVNEGPMAYNYSAVMNRNTLYLNLSALNIGKTIIPYANVSLQDSDHFQRVAPYYMDEWTLYNLPAMESRGDSNSVPFKLRDDVSLISPGKYNLKFRIICPICKDLVYYKYITICVYQNDPVQDCGGIWWYRQHY